MARPRKRAVHGIVLLDKPSGMSSNRALQRVKHLYHAAKAGHTGSLDPLATGLLPLCFGEATKVAGHMLGAEKAYAADCHLGISTDTDDADGTTTARRDVPTTLTAADIETELAAFVGRIQQVPPEFSALKRDGEPAYARARRGEEVTLEARPVDIQRIELVAWEPPQLRLRVTCGAGTYIRAVARDIGERLGCGGHLTGLRRLWVDPFTAPAMYSIEALEQMDDATRDGALLPVDAGLQTLPAVCLDADETRALANGQSVPRSDFPVGSCRAYAADGRLLALAECGADGRVRVRRGFNLPEPPETVLGADSPAS